MQNEDFRKIYPSHDKEDTEISLLRKRHRGEDVSWTLEEEFLFFEIYKIFGNKWTKFVYFFPDKKVNELKNHFHSCLNKAVRRIIHKKFKEEFIEIVRCFYSIDALINLMKEIDENEKKSFEDISTSHSIIKLKKSKINSKRKDNKYNPKRLFFTGELTNDMLIKYKKILIKEFLLKKPEVIEFLSTNNKLLNFKVEEVSWLFSIVIKTKLIYKCKQCMKLQNINNDNIKILSEYINDNSMFVNDNFENY